MRARNARNANEKPVETSSESSRQTDGSKVEQRTPRADGLVRLAYHPVNLELDIDKYLSDLSSITSSDNHKSSDERL
jgi:hypothetical protein